MINLQFDHLILSLVAMLFVGALTGVWSASRVAGRNARVGERLAYERGKRVGEQAGEKVGVASRSRRNVGRQLLNKEGGKL